ncbi:MULTISPECIES: CDP-alcohol phosphatidyltransferase family protein [Amycolatopsis]|uniref:Phosphatidylcholine/phosphatidylserine synthase n=1 Tax=Amycolatopsis thermalba TaxID=944492 RepID=A0ABY4P5C7_9PSEU|nr:MULTISPECIES: phosphatidylcholine/phosphatidylserine synthase [Amycolatopsis]OXM72090.1 phosphatidylserine synthase [Amycolatopsis sp. KNN50.9b]UQS27494.1 phosphatidylcholine/phosphatidylserine synthase [Amycolatopsis thermalba]
MVRVMTPSVRLLPNAITVLALCAGLSAAQFALNRQFVLAIGAIGVAAVLDSLDGRIARLLDATSKMGAELDSLSDAISFGVSPALVLYIWFGDTSGIGWIVSLTFAVCIVLRLARFNTLLDVEKPPYAKEFFVGVPAPAGGLCALMPVILTLEFGDGWWSSAPVVYVWTVAIALLLISRLPTLSLKSVKVPAKAAAPLLVGVGLAAAAIIQYPLIALAVALLLYLAHIPYAIRRYQWLASHPEAWGVPLRERRAIRRSTSRLRLRRPRIRVAGNQRLSVRRTQDHVVRGVRTYPAESQDRARRRSWRRIGLRQRNR